MVFFPKVGMVANMRHVKGRDIFIRMAAILAASHPNVVFELAGDGEDASLNRMINEFGIQSRVKLIGRVIDIPLFLSSLDVAVLTSRSEGLSNAILEHMAAGRPIVATAVGGNVELIKDRINGILVPPEDPKAVANAVGRLLDNPELAGQLGASAKHQVEQKYSLSAMVKRYEDFYLRLLAA